MNKRLTGAIALGKLVRHAARLRGKGGSALPGLVVERIMPDFLPTMLHSLPDGVVVVTGTNGKTTTTKMIADLLTTLGKRVLTNKTGSNFTRGIVAAIVQQAKLGGKLDYDIAVIELDEAYAKRLVETVKPTYTVALNVMRDQLDRFGEIDATAKLMQSVLQATTKSCVLNRDDPHLRDIGAQLNTPVHYYGVDESLRSLFPADEELLAVQTPVKRPAKLPKAAVELMKCENQTATYRIGPKRYRETLQLNGLYNFQNAAAALALVRLILPDVGPEKLLHQLAHIKPAFGRGEMVMIGDQPLELVLVKNPAGFRLSLRSFNTAAATMIAINDNYPDGRDMSWLWDVDFHQFRASDVNTVSGIRAYDMALRLQYDLVDVTQIEPDLTKALRQFLRHNPDQPKRIFCTYTAMLSLRSHLSKLANTEKVL